MNWNHEVKRRRKPSYVYRLLGIHTYKIGIIYKKKIRAAKLKKWCVEKGGGGRTAYRVGNLIYVKFDFCFTSFETFFFQILKKFRIIFNHFYAENQKN